MSTNKLIYIITDQNFYKPLDNELHEPYELEIKKFAHLDVFAKAVQLKAPDFVVIESKSRTFKKSVKSLLRHNSSTKIEIINRSPNQSDAQLFTQIYDRTVNKRKLRAQIRASIIIGAFLVSIICTFSFMNQDQLDFIILINAIILFSISTVLYLVDPTDWIIRE